MTYGYVYDTETQFYYLQSRYYDPEIGRFINADSYASTGQGILGNNMFAYCGNNPVNYCDPAGEAYTDIYAVCYGEDHLRDITEELNKAMLRHAEELYFTYERFGYLGAAILFKENVKTGGDWDLKNRPEWNLREGEKYIYNGMVISFDDPGNIHYGFVGSELFPEEILLLFAGLYQIKSDTSKLSYADTYFDDPRDQRAIAYGIELWEGLNRD